MQRFRPLAASLLLTAVCGCSQLAEGLNAVNPLAKKYLTADKQNPAVELACVWQPGQGPNSQGVPVRGFSGQMFFFTQRSSEPALVDGSIRIYLFADRGTPEERTKPMHQYDFTPEAWSSHATLTSLGPGYSVFVPYPGNEAHQVRCHLRACFTPREGRPIWSESVTMILEGPPRTGQEPISWANAENAQPTSNSIEVFNRRGTPAQLNGSDMSEPRSLRTDTFALGSIQRTGYEAPARRYGSNTTVASERKSEVETTPAGLLPKPVDRRFDQLSSRHPLTSHHPFLTTDGVAAGLSSQQREMAVPMPPRPQTVPLRQHPLAEVRPLPHDLRSGPLNDSHPHNRQPMARNAPAPQGSTARDGDSPSVRLRRPVGLPYRGELGIPPRTAAESPWEQHSSGNDSAYGVWQPVSE